MIPNFTTEEKDIKNIFNRLRRRDFSGTTGQIVRNSTYQLISNLVLKVGALIFVIIMARLLAPELYGLYSLAMGTIILFSSFTDFGIVIALVTYVPNLLKEKNEGKAKGYVKKLFKLKILFVLVSTAILFFSSYFISNIYYNKPIFYALLIGCIYSSLVSIFGFLEQMFRAKNNFKVPMIKESIFQSSRIILVPILTLFLIKANLKQEIFIMAIILGITFCYIISFAFLLLSSKKEFKFLKSKEKKLDKNEKKDLKKFILPLASISLSGVFFGYIDMIMLGRFVESVFIAYYGAALYLATSISIIIGFTSMSILPILSGVKGKSLESIFKKTRRFVLLISFFVAILTYLLSFYIVSFAYGEAYLTSVPILKYFSILILILPTLGLYDAYFISQKKTKIIAKLSIFTTVLNIILNLFFINYGLNYGMMEAILGACIATILSKIIYLAGLVWQKRKISKDLYHETS